ncbi:hypothetical protein ACQUW5_10540 [Legionella sp. CNM-1927-20]|uniref:hypothetical protein n=1 Tax=Legionella sp. CNM-1927-20 TaxID=3422221 RepID=UPI00403B339E
MQKVISGCFWGLICLSITYADSSSEFNLQEDKNAENSCIQKILIACINKCQQAGGENCVELCRENAKNECRQAGQ